MNLRKRVVAGMLLFCMTTGLTACTKTDEGDSLASQEETKKESGLEKLSSGIKNLMEGIEVQAATPKGELEEEKLAAITDFSVRLLQDCVTADNGENTILSPISVLYALAMTANGAAGETLTQMESVFGMSIAELNECLHGCLWHYENAKYKLSLANSIWFTEEESRKFKANPDFLQKNAEYYDADIYQTIFDNAAKDAINAWVSENTDGMIEDILDQIPEDAIMYLVNAIAFDAEWQNTYKEWDIQEGTFTTALGKEQKVDFMYSDERTYLEDENATGMLKYYSGRKYAFAALLPNEGMTVEEYVKTLDGAALQSILHNQTSVDVEVALPKFTCEADYNMNDVLSAMGMPKAFDKLRADFTGMGTVPGDYNISISRVLHKAKIEVNESGTKAGAATVVEMVNTATGMMPVERKEVILNRPFVYMIIDCESNLPIFMGTVAEFE